MGNLSRTLGAQRRHREAERIILQCLEIQERATDAENHHTVAFRFDLADHVANQEGRLPEAETLAREAVQTAVQVFGRDHPSVADAVKLLASILEKQGKHNEAVEVGRRVGQ